MSADLEKQAAWEGSFFGFLYRQFLDTIPPIPASVDLSGQTAIVTGSNVGLGFESVRLLLSHKLSHVILAVRSQSRGDDASARLQAEFPDARIEVWIVDMLSYDSIAKFARRCESLPRLDIAILNAGLMTVDYQIAEETQREVTLQVNYISTALLSVLLLPTLKAKKHGGSPGRLTIIGSDMSYSYRHKDSGAAPVFDLIKAPSSSDRYLISKLFLLWFVQELAKRVPPEDVIVNVANPGACRDTSFFQDHTTGLGFKIALNVMARSVEVGARSYVNGVAVQGKASHGSFLCEGRIKPYPQIMYTATGHELGQRLWDETMKELDFAGVAGIINGMRK